VSVHGDGMVCGLGVGWLMGSDERRMLRDYAVARVDRHWYTLGALLLALTYLLEREA